MMTIPCSMTYRDVPICSVHGCALLQKQIPIDRLQPHLGTLTCLVCPVSTETPHNFWVIPGQNDTLYLSPTRQHRFTFRWKAVRRLRKILPCQIAEQFVGEVSDRLRKIDGRQSHRSQLMEGVSADAVESVLAARDGMVWIGSDHLQAFERGAPLSAHQGPPGCGGGRSVGCQQWLSQ